MKTNQSNKTNKINISNQVFYGNNTILMDEPRRKFLSFYQSKNRLIKEENDSPFYKAFKSFLENH